MNPTVSQDMSVITLITNASVLVQLVMAGLLIASMFSWYYIFLKVIGTATSGWNLPYAFPLETALRITLFVVGAAALAGFFPGRRAAGIDVKAALAYE